MRRNHFRYMSVFLVVLAAQSLAEESVISPEQGIFFEQKIRPLLIERCYGCHSEANQVKGRLRLDFREGWQKGGETGPAIVPGQPDASLLIRSIRYSDFDLQMPPTGKLSDAEIARLEEWVQMGAPDPRELKTEAMPEKNASAGLETHWSYLPLKSVIPPVVNDENWIRNDIDRYILATLEKNGFKPSPDANRYSWLRRVSLDLTGLPPSVDEILAFHADPAESAFEVVVDRLLATPAFGERWARPWLDLVGYADQVGSANNVPAELAWRYRDYLIRAMNADRPFNEFIHEQIAGDLLVATSIEQRQDQLTATGFLVLGNVNIVEGDKLVMRMDLVDQQIEKMGKAFLGMTLNCARCHDHKFDPITLKDYYGLAGIFSSTDSTYRADRGVWSGVAKSQLPETLEQFQQRQLRLRIHEQKVAAVNDEHRDVENKIKNIDQQINSLKDSAPNPVDPQKPLADLEKERSELAGRFSGLDQRLWHLNFIEPSTPETFAVKDAAIPANAKVQVRGNPHVLGAEIPRGFVQIATHGSVPQIRNDESGRRQLADWLTDAASPLVSRVAVNRIWARLFGQGIVGSLDYFGVRGDRPTHPDLLDDLAGRFIQEGWSQKALIRSLVLSRTYRQRSEIDETSRLALTKDPDNRLYWRMSPRRLDAEMLRDSVLMVSGSLEPCAGGPSLALEFPENVGGLNPKDVNPISFSLSRFRENQQRVRTIYLPVVRSSDQRGPAEVLNFFDFPQPAQLVGNRSTTAVSSQTLFLLNGPLLKNASQNLVQTLISDSVMTTDSERVRSLYMKVLNRPPQVDELQAAEFFLNTSDGSNETSSESDVGVDKVVVWQRLVHALLACNEFLFRL